MHNLTTGYVTETRDIMWLHCMYYDKPETSDKAIVYLQVALPLEVEEAREGEMLNASLPKIESKDEKNEWNAVHLRSGRVVKSLILYIKNTV